MPVASSPVTLTAGTQVDLTPPITPAVSQVWYVRLDNVSPYPLTVSVNGKAGWLAPGQTDLFSAKSGPASVSVTPQQAPNGTAPAGSSSYVLATWAVSPDVIPGTFPTSSALTTVALSSDSTVNINAGTVQVENVPEGVVSTFVKSPEAINTPLVNSGAFSSSAYLGNLGIIVYVLVWLPSAGTGSGTLTVNPSTPGWAQSNPSTLNFTLGGTTNSYANWCFWKILDENDLTATMDYAGSFPPISGVYSAWMTIGSGGNNAFSNQSLTGLLSGPITWGSTGTSNTNLSLPSATPGLMIASIAQDAGGTIDYSIGKQYIGGGSAIWLASSQTGPLSVETSSNPEDPGVMLSPDTGLVIPQ